MGFRIRKSVKIAPGVRVNLSNKSVGVSVGNKFVRRSVSTSGRTTTTTHIPGTPISHVSTSTSGSKPHGQHHSSAPAQQTASPLTLKIAGVIALVFGILASLMGLISITVGGWILLIPGLLLAWLGFSWLKAAKRPDKEQSAE